MIATKFSYIAFALLVFSGTSLFGQSYLDVSGANLDYTNINETTGGGLFGQPVAAGDVLDFPVAAFAANATDGAIDFLDGVLRLDASSNSGQTFSSVSLDEFGVYFNTGDSTSEVTAFLTVLTSDGTFTDTFDFSFGAGNGLWTGQAFVTFPETLEATVFVHNILLADSAPGGVASINKRDVRLNFGTEIPEPTTFGLLAIGLIGLASRRRR